MGSSEISWNISASPELRSANQIVNAAVAEWQDQEASRYDDARASYAKMFPVMPASQQGRKMDYDDRSVDDAYVFPNVDEKDVKTKEKRVKLTISGELLATMAPNQWEFRNELLNLLIAEHGESVSSFKVVKVPAKRKPVAVTTEGKAVTVYRVYGVTGNQERVLSEELPSQAEARQKALELCGEDATGSRFSANQGWESYEVRASIRRDAGDKAVVRVARPVPESATIELLVKFQTIVPNAKVTSYTVSFYYHS